MQLVAACPRSITAVGSRLASRGYGTPQGPVALVAAGEEWPDGRLCPALEDLLARASSICDLYAQGAGSLSAGAAATKASHEGTAGIAHAGATGTSGRQPTTPGFVEDVAVVTEEDARTLAPVRDGDGAFAPG
ncbi:hypothetical protein P1P68_23995 [Streptomyces scabiei]|uniref:hypothetical protein n=1 Tax=Streptomyces scabiei TaxID=1930 RepID=UPI00299080E5|nr:hypothetical protein [Streptomyces scabiei]MDW8807762.1 hypothetical protein [Streptomyces scabiei]